jgi:hypothetical protein
MSEQGSAPVVRLRRAWRTLAPEGRLAAFAALGLFLAMLLPWYQQNAVVTDGRAAPLVSRDLSAFAVFSFVEAAVLLVSAGVLYLVWARSQRKAFHLPGGDGTVIMAAGGWASLLLVWRVFDTPESPDTEFGLQWGIFAALLVAGVLTAAGARVRAAHRPEPPNPMADDAGWERPPRAERRPERRPREATAVTDVLRERPDWEGEPPEPPGRAERRGAVGARDETPDERPPDDDRLF